MSRANLDFLTYVLQLEAVPGDVEKKTKMIVEHVERAKSLGAHFFVTNELATSDYMLGDNWENDAFIREIQDANQVIRNATQGIAATWGSVVADFDRIGEDGRVRKYNAANVAQNGVWVSNGTLPGFVPKTNMPEYRIFDDPRHFYSATKLAAELGMPLSKLLQPFELELNGRKVRVAIAICEDFWQDEYFTKPSLIYRGQGVDFAVDISQSPFTAEKWKARDKMLRNRAREMGVPVLYVNSVGLQNNLKNQIWFDGGSCLMAPDGVMRWMGPLHQEYGGVINMAKLHDHPDVFRHPEGIEEKHGAMIAAIRTFHKPYGRPVIGLSGGIDSAVSAAVYTEALGREYPLAINMPTRNNSRTTRTLAEQCAGNLHIEYRVVPVQGLYDEHLRVAGVAGYSSPSEFDQENMQGRIRGAVLADVSALESRRIGRRCYFTCNGNKTEISFNYFTLYGDGAGLIAWLADLYKGEVYDLARFMNARAEGDLIPQAIIDLIPSAELSASQNVDEGKGDPIFYPFHDRLVHAFAERRWDPTHIVETLTKGGAESLEHALGCEPGTVRKFFPTPKALIDNLEWSWSAYSFDGKRHMLPSVFLTSRRAFGFDRRAYLGPVQLTRAYKNSRDSFLKADAWAA